MAALTVGRVLTGVFAGRVGAPRVVLSCGAALVALALVMRVPALAPLAVILSGLALAPVFGTTLAWLSQVLSARLVPLLLVAGSLGGVLSPWLLGQAFARFGAGAVPVTLAVLAALMLLFTALARRGARAAA